MIKDIQNYSNKYLQQRKEALKCLIDDSERDLSQTKSQFFKASIKHTIKKYTLELHLIEAEICYRKCHNERLEEKNNGLFNNQKLFFGKK